MKQGNSLYTAFLILVVVLSAICIGLYDFYPKRPHSGYAGSLQLTGPGILFSFFITLLYRKHFPPLRLLLYFLILIVFYVLAVFCCMASWGSLVPVFGGGGILISYLFERKTDVKQLISSPLFRRGCLSSLAGLIMFYVLMNNAAPAGPGFACITGLWQLAIGRACFKAQLNQQHSATPVLFIRNS